MPLVCTPLIFRLSGDMTGNCRLSGDMRWNLRGLSKPKLAPSSISKVNFFGAAGEAKWEFADSLGLKGDMLALIRGPKPRFGVGSKFLESEPKGTGCAM